jgi:selenocysteine-specific elongation factor
MKSIVVGTAGHIDHGKSALVQALTGTDPDRLKEEKARGITIDLGFAHAAIDGINFAFVDVPGHERFVKNMLAGAGGIDLVLLVVAADESVMPQTREHFEICRLLRVPVGIVALTKADLADPEMMDLARLEVRDLVAGSFLDGAPIVPVSSRDRTGLEALSAALVEASARIASRAAAGPARLPIDRVFSMKGFGTVVTGTLVSGTISVDTDLELVPGGRRVKVRGIQVHGERRMSAAAGQRSAVNLGGVDVADIQRGQNLVSPAAFVSTRVADVSIEVLPDGRPLRHGARIRFHQGTVEVIGRVAIIDPSATEIAPGQRGFVRLRLESPALLARGDRYILRAYSPPATIAGGVILDPQSPRDRVRSAAALPRCRALDFDPAVGDRVDADCRAAAAIVADAGPAGVPVAALVTRVGVDPSALDARIRDLTARGAATRADDVLLAPAVLAGLEASILAALADHHRDQVLSDGVPREELRTRLFRRGHPAIFERALAELAASSRIVLRDRVALATHRIELTPEEARARDVIERAYREAALRPPDASTLSASAGVPAPVADRVLKLLQRQRVLVRVDSLLFHDAALKQLKDDVASLKATAGAGARIDVATFKERFGVTRKFAIPLLEYLDRERVTRRAGDSRVVL